MGSDFRFVDDMRTRQTTIRDLLAHRTGLPSYKMALMVGLEPAHSRQDYCLYVQRPRVYHLNMHEMSTIAIYNPGRLSVCHAVSQSVCHAALCGCEKRLNGSGFCLEWTSGDSYGPKKHCIRRDLMDSMWPSPTYFGHLFYKITLRV